MFVSFRGRHRPPGGSEAANDIVAEGIPCKRQGKQRAGECGGGAHGDRKIFEHNSFDERLPPCFGCWWGIRDRYPAVGFPAGVPVSGKIGGGGSYRASIIVPMFRQLIIASPAAAGAMAAALVVAVAFDGARR